MAAARVAGFAAGLCCLTTVLFLMSCVVSVCQAKSIKEHMFMSDVNLEHFYILEENVLSHADILLRENYFGADDHEDEEEHKKHAPNLTEFHSAIESTKDIHEVAGPQLDAYLSNPVNLYHLLSRLNKQWRQMLNLMVDAKPCKGHGVHSFAIKNNLNWLRKSLPGQYELQRLVHFISLLQRIHGLSPDAVAKGNLHDDVTSLSPLTVEEQLDFSKMLQEMEDPGSALPWLQQVEKWLADHPGDNDLGVNRANILLQIASAHYSLEDYASAVKTAEKALELDPDSKVAQRNVGYFKGKLERTTKKAKKPKILRNRFEKICSSMKPKTSRKSCYYTRLGLTFIKTEVVRTNPRVVLFHELIHEKVTRHLKEFARKQQTNKAWVGEERYITPDFRVSLHPKKMHGVSRYIRAAAQNLVDAVYTLGMKVLDMSMDRWGTPQIVNLGLDGMHLSRHDRDLGVVKPTHGETGVFYTFLNSPKGGGEAVFHKLGVTAEPSNGSVLFYYTSKQPAHSHCPILGESIWMVVHPIYENPRNYCLPEDE